MKRLVALFLVHASLSASAGSLTDTLPKGMFMLEESFNISDLAHRWDDEGRAAPLLDRLELREPGSGLQGILIPNANVRYMILISQLMYGVTDWLTVGVAVPLVVQTSVDLKMEWIPGDYQQYLGRSYSEEDFWQWAESMGQPRPRDWTGNRGKLSDIVLGVRFKFSELLGSYWPRELTAALLVMGALPTGSAPPPEKLVAAGTTLWELHSQGELSFHLAVEREFARRFTLGLDAFYEVFFPREYKTPTGVENPLLLKLAPYVGDHYTLDPGDFAGLALQLEFVAWRGTARPNWLTEGDAGRAGKLPPILVLSATYKYTYVAQSDWSSQSAIWDWEKEKLWLPGHKNTLWFRAALNLFRFGIPLQLNVGYRNQSWLAGRNVRAADVLMVGMRVPAKFF